MTVLPEVIIGSVLLRVSVKSLFIPLLPALSGTRTHRLRPDLLSWSCSLCGRWLSSDSFSLPTCRGDKPLSCSSKLGFVFHSPPQERLLWLIDMMEVGHLLNGGFLSVKDPYRKQRQKEDVSVSRGVVWSFCCGFVCSVSHSGFSFPTTAVKEPECSRLRMVVVTFGSTRFFYTHVLVYFWRVITQIERSRTPFSRLPVSLHVSLTLCGSVLLFDPSSSSFAFTMSWTAPQSLASKPAYQAKKTNSDVDQNAGSPALIFSQKTVKQFLLKAHLVTLVKRETGTN